MRKGNTMNEVTIAFDVTGTFEQDIEILTKDTPEQFVEKLQKGEYWATLCIPAKAVVVNVDGDEVGIIKDTSVQDHTEYNDFDQKVTV